jgi:hypothetical protein
METSLLEKKRTIGKLLYQPGYRDKFGLRVMTSDVALTTLVFCFSEVPNLNAFATPRNTN